MYKAMGLSSMGHIKGGTFSLPIYYGGPLFLHFTGTTLNYNLTFKSGQTTPLNLIAILLSNEL